MQTFRKFLLGVSIIVLLLLAALSVGGSFLGPDRARAMFNSIPVVMLWCVLALGLVASLASARTLRRPGVLAMHLGPLLILAGAMWGSTSVYGLRTLLVGQPKTPTGFMAISEGKSESVLWDRQSGTALGELDFEVRLDDFSIEYYPTDSQDRWQFVVEAIAPRTEGQPIQWQPGLATWTLGKEKQLPFCEVTLRVDEYYLNQYGTAPDAPTLPAAKVTLRLGDRTQDNTFQPRPGLGYDRLPLAGVYDSARAWHDAGSPVLYFQSPPAVIKDYKSALVVTVDGKDVASKTIEVNKPLHYGGYHFYQYDYDHDSGSYTVLSVVSDSGLNLIYAGFATLFAGVVVSMILPSKKSARRQVN